MDQVTEVMEPDAVFVDPSGRRRRFARNAGIAVGCVLTAYLLIVAFGFVSGSRAPLTPWPAAKPSHRGVLPGHGRVAEPSPTRSTVIATPGPRTDAPTSRSTPKKRAASPAPATSTSRSGKGRGYGRTKTPNPRKP